MKNNQLIKKEQLLWRSTVADRRLVKDTYIRTNGNWWT